MSAEPLSHFVETHEKLQIVTITAIKYLSTTSFSLSMHVCGTEWLKIWYSCVRSKCLVNNVQEWRMIEELRKNVWKTSSVFQQIWRRLYLQLHRVLLCFTRDFSVYFIIYSQFLESKSILTDHSRMYIAEGNVFHCTYLTWPADFHSIKNIKLANNHG